VIAGSGAGAGPLALTLARAGWQVTVLERGPAHDRRDYPRDERRKRSFFLPDLSTERHHVVTAATHQPVATDLGWIATCVGGGTVHMGAYLYRFHPEDFRMRSHFGSRYELADWPYSYEELEPYYQQAEWAVGVAGSANLAPPLCGARSGDYPMPPLAAHPLAGRFETVARARGLHPFPTPRAINSRDYEGRSACSYCDVCAGYGCPTGARGSSQETLIAAAESTGRCELRTEASVSEILIDAGGRASGFLYFDAEGQEQRVEGDLVCVCCSAVESARLLLLSRSRRFPDGIGNANGLVGRHLQFHGVSFGRGRLRRPLADAEREGGSPFLGRSLLDHYFLPPNVGEIEKGGILRFFLPPPEPLADAEAEITKSGSPLWGDALCARLRARYRDALDIGFEVFHDFLPNAGTFVELDPDAQDSRGLPIARIHLDLPAHHRLAGRWLLDRGFELLDDLGAEDLETTDLGGTSSYLVEGSCRMGAEPATSVLDPFCRVHGVPNLFVVDGSCMPTSGGAPPTLTILANSFRVADHIVRDL